MQNIVAHGYSGVRYASLDFLDISKIDSLIRANFAGMEINTVNVSNCRNLSSIYCGYISGVKNSYNIIAENCNMLSNVSLNTVEIYNLDLKNCYNLGVFKIENCTNIGSINLNNCINITSMYFNYSSFSNDFEIDMSNLNKLKRIDWMFYKTNIMNMSPIQKILTNIQWDNIISSSSLFYSTNFSGNKVLIENIGIKDLSNMFAKTTLEEVTFNNLYKVEKISGNVFYNCDTLKKLNIYNSSVSDMNLYKDRSLPDCSLTDVDIQDCNRLRTINIGSSKRDLQHINIINCPSFTNMTYLLNYCTNIKSVNFKNLSGVISAVYTFDNSNIMDATDILTNSNFINLQNCYSMFGSCDKIQEVTLDGNSLPSLKDISSMFINAHYLSNVTFQNFINHNNINTHAFGVNTYVKNLNFINCSANSINVQNMFYAYSDSHLQSIEELVLDNCMINLNPICYAIGRSEGKYLKNITVNGDFVPFTNSYFLRNCESLEYVFSNEQYPLYMSLWGNDVNKYQINAFTNKDIYLYLNTSSSYIQDTSIPFMGRDLSKLAQFDVEQLNSYSGIKKIIYVPNIPTTNGNNKTFNIMDIVGAREVEVKNLDLINNLKNISIIASDAVNKNSLDNYVLKNQTINLGSLNKIDTLYTKYDNSLSKPNYIQDLQFTNFGKAYVDGFRTEATLKIENLPALTSNCLANIIENGLCNLAESSLTGNVYMCNEQTSRLTEDNLTLLNAKGWTLQEV